jgi:hypothetical protein
MTQYGTWVSYGGTADIVLAIVLAGAAAGVAYAGFRLPLPAPLPRPGRTAKVILLVAWLLSIVAFVTCFALYALHAEREHLGHAPPADPITPVTVICFGIVWIAIALMHNARGWRIALGSAVIGALAAPMIFEFPFDLIVMTRIYPPMAPDPALYRALFFVPLFLVEVTTVARLTLSPVVRVSRATFWCFAAMLAVFAVWGLIGFGYPSSPAPFALNVASKILAFLTVLSMFLPDRSQASTESPEELEPVPQAWTSVM